MNGKELPLSFVMNLAQNETALKRFEAMSKEEKEAIIKKTHEINSREEMRNLVNNLSNNSFTG
ncbi:MAG: hypothetical protein NC213_07720 [Acetobacter sp.]|nr:hypothetical protein [Bacteroides sp.]MCM1341617.1 hypothetical protein [Acetobacter sp.]MCM1434062.1 hypothetical protein [Clostridiales bacterium]